MSSSSSPSKKGSPNKESIDLRKASRGEEDEAMNSLFEGQGPYSEEFSVTELTNPASSPICRIDYEDDSEVQARRISDCRIRNVDYSFHRSDTFPHVPPLLRPHHHHHSRHKTRRKEHPHTDDEEDNKDSSQDKRPVKFEVGGPSLEDGWSNRPPLYEDVVTSSHPDTDEHDLTSKYSRTRTPTDASVLSTDDEDFLTTPLLSPQVLRLRPCIRPSETDTAGSEDELGRKKGKVKFNIGSDFPESDVENRQRIHRKRKHHRRRPEDAEDPIWRRSRGSETHPANEKNTYHFSSPDEEALQLKEHAREDISSHRYEDPGHHRRHRVRAKSSLSSFIHPSAGQDSHKKGKKLPIMKKTFDHAPHEVFVELSELYHSPSTGDFEWKESARWIKYEENVDGVDNRWGRPHLAFLNFNALFSLRKALERGAVLLDLDERDLPSIAARVVDSMVAREQIPSDQRDAVVRILLLRHKHIKEHIGAFRRGSRSSKLHLENASEEKLPNSQSSSTLERRSSRKGTLSNIFHVNTFGSFSRRSSADDVVQNGGKAVRRQSSFTQIDLDDPVEKEKIRNNTELMRKIPEGAEATAVLVGAVDFLKQPTIAFVRLAEGVIMENVVEVPIPVRFLFILLGPFHGEMDYHEVGRCISTLMSDKSFHEVAYRAHSRGQLLTAINEFLNTSIVLPPADWSNKDLVPIDDIRAKSQEMMKKTESMRLKKKSQTTISPLPCPEDEVPSDQPPPRDPLKREGKLFHGLIQDVKIRYSNYLSDIKDGLNAQVLSATIFIFFASLSPSITFGGIYADQTDRFIGVGETLLVTSINGMIFALFAAQPLLIVGATGPLMIFDMSLLQFCNSQGLDYLSIRVWVGIWMIVIGLVVAAFELVAIVKHFSRFTEEIFSTLVCIIFIYGAFENLANIFRLHPLNSGPKDMDLSLMNNATYENSSGVIDDDMSDEALNMTGFANATEKSSTIEYNQPNTALLSMCLMLGTFFIAFKLKKFRNSKFLGRSVRRALGDFGVPIAIFSMVLLDYLIHDTYTDKLQMPKGLQPSSPIRGWLINPFGVTKPLPLWCMIAAGPAALLLFILIFLEENICHLILSKPERCLKKGSGFHLDIVLSCLVNTVAGFLGAPFMGPACVRTISHMSALTIVSSNVPPGESPKIVGCQEQRISGFLVALLVGLGVLLYAVLNLVPTSVLLGIFLYMGVSATAGIQLIERIVLYFMPVKHHPNVAYVKKVKTWKMHVFTGIQLVMLIVLWIVKQSPASLCVPFILMLLIPIRLYLLPQVFSGMELMALDGTEQASLMTSPYSEPDFYETAHDLPVHFEEELESHNHQS